MMVKKMTLTAADDGNIQYLIGDRDAANANVGEYHSFIDESGFTGSALFPVLGFQPYPNIALLQRNTSSIDVLTFKVCL